MRDDAGRGTDEREESRDGTWNSPAGDEDVSEAPSGEESREEYYNQQYEAGAVDDEEQDDAGSSGNVAGEFQPSETIEPGTPSLENSLFVAVGAYVAVLGLARLFVGGQGFGARNLLVLTGGTLLVSLVLLGFFGTLTPDT